MRLAGPPNAAVYSSPLLADLLSVSVRGMDDGPRPAAATETLQTLIPAVTDNDVCSSHLISAATENDACSSAPISAPIQNDVCSSAPIPAAVQVEASNRITDTVVEEDAEEEEVATEDADAGIRRVYPAPRSGAKSVCGRRSEMEDAVAIVPNFLSLEHGSDLHFFGVYDGHGGAQAAKHCREHLHRAVAEEVRRCIEEQPDASLEKEETWEKAMKVSFLRMDTEVGCRGGAVAGSGNPPPPSPPAWSDTVGSTATVAVISASHVIVANCGDSRAVLCRAGHALPLSQDHKPEREDEMARIEAAGGRVISWNGYRVLGVLAMSRAIGDHFLKPYIIADPDLTMTTRTDEDEFLVIASDGLWDVINNQDACAIARRFLYGGNGSRGPNTAAAALVHAAHEKGSSDNISVVVVDLRKHKRNHHHHHHP